MIVLPPWWDVSVVLTPIAICLLGLAMIAWLELTPTRPQRPRR